MRRKLHITIVLAAVAAYLFGLVSIGARAEPSRAGAQHADAGALGADISEPLVNVKGEVRLVENASTRPAADSSHVVIWLVPSKPTAVSAKPLLAKRRYRMLQHKKMFDPNLLVVPVGSVVDFPNLDPWFHNVFSLYQGKRFDLGLYQAGAEKAVVFDRLGPSFLFCNIHPQMTAVVLTVDSDWFGVSDKEGRVSITQVPSGLYRMHVWYESASPDFGGAAPRVVEISQTSDMLPAISIPVMKRNHSHKNKYGDDYDPKASSPAY